MVAEKASVVFYNFLAILRQYNVIKVAIFNRYSFQLDLICILVTIESFHAA